MTDTPDYVKKIHLELWLAKPPGERLRQFLINNEEFYAFCKVMKEQMVQKYPSSTPTGH